MSAIKKRPTVCLNMIVKNESRVIERCLASLKSIVDHWVIVDTGSTDGTQDIIRAILSDVPGELYEREWKDFGHNRTEAIRLAKGKADYLFVIDADEVVSLAPDFSWDALHQDAYSVQYYDNGVSYTRCQLVSDRFEWSYKGVLHEFIESKEPTTQAFYPGITIVRYLDGERSSDPQKFRKDAEILEKALLDEPGNDRYQFYLAQSYRDCGEIDLALLNYQKRVARGGWDQEVWFSMYQIAQLLERKGETWAIVLEAYLKAYQLRPSRVGPLFRILRHYMSENQFQTAYIFGKTAIEIPFPTDSLFVEQSIYDIHLPLEFGICAYYSGKDDDAIRSNNQLLKREGLPGDLFLRALENRRYSLERKFPRRSTPLDLKRKMKVFVLLNDAGHFLDNCVERLGQQDYENIEMIFVDFGSTGEARAKIPLDDERVEYIRLEESVPAARWIAESLGVYCEKEDIIFLMNGDDWLESDDTLSFINRYFNERACRFLWGQFRFSDGSYGKAMPLSGKNAVGTEAFFPIAFAFDGEAFRQLVAARSLASLFQDAAQDWISPDAALDALAKEFIRQLDEPEAHFTDQVLIVYNTERFSDLIYPGTEQWLKKDDKR